MSVKQVQVCAGMAQECNGECYRCRLGALRVERDALLAAAKAALPYVESHNGMFTDIVSEKLRQAISEAENGRT